jgi:hypothetical protein
MDLVDSDGKDELNSKVAGAIRLRVLICVDSSI